MQDRALYHELLNWAFWVNKRLILGGWVVWVPDVVLARCGRSFLDAFTTLML